ncbi:MAG: hypothetical protein M1826_005214 [Phylliscum demangeonii]|nr:MAG: hypothetical protein M1826_005214 [Phylliscum demangeonii]
MPTPTPAPTVNSSSHRGTRDSSMTTIGSWFDPTWTDEPTSTDEPTRAPTPTPATDLDPIAELRRVGLLPPPGRTMVFTGHFSFQLGPRLARGQENDEEEEEEDDEEEQEEDNDEEYDDEDVVVKKEDAEKYQKKGKKVANELGYMKMR